MWPFCYSGNSLGSLIEVPKSLLLRRRVGFIAITLTEKFVKHSCGTFHLSVVSSNSGLHWFCFAWFSEGSILKGHTQICMRKTLF